MLRVMWFATVFVVLLAPASAGAEGAPLRLAAAVDCSRNPNCIPGLRRVYHFDPSGSLVRLKVADSGIQALDDGLAEVAVAFTSNPQLSRPDIVTLRDDRHMITPDHVVPIVRSSLLARYGPSLRRRLDAASRLLTTSPARAQPGGPRRPPARGGRRRVRRRQRRWAATRRTRAPARGSSSASRSSPRTRRSPTSTPRHCAAPGFRVDRAQRRWPAAGGRRGAAPRARSGCTRATRARCWATSAGPR